MNREERAQIFANVYENNRWGRSKSGRKYYSDSPLELTKPYRDFVSSFIKKNNIRRIVDIGCGDFEASSGIDIGNAHYIGVDIYEKLIDYDIEHFQDETHEFKVCDIVLDELPEGDLCLVTLVLYLLDFDEVFIILEKLKKYRYVLITDGQPNIEPSQRRNVNKKTDEYARSYHNIGFYLELPPFELDLSVVCEYQYPTTGELLRTVLIEHPE